MVLLNYNFTVPCMPTRSDTGNPQCIPVTCLRGPRFVVEWNIQGSFNLPYAIRGSHGIATCLVKYLTMPYTTRI